MTLDKTDLRMAMVALSYYRRAHVLSKRPVPAAADRLADHLQQAMAASGHESVVAQVDWLSTREVVQRRICSERTARRLAERVGRKFGRGWFIPADALPQQEGEDDVTADQ